MRNLHAHRLQVWLRLICWLTFCVGGVGLASPVSAQSIFEHLFGGNDHRPQQQTVTERSTAPLFRGERWRAERSMRPPVHQSQPEEAETGGEMVQTMCVRTCDGFYWPVRFPVARRDLHQDANICEATCGTAAKLYTRAGPGVEAEEMKDADGTSYGASANAFAYRRGLVTGCSCRPMPWSVSERARHEGYALVEAEKAIRLAEAEADAKRGAEAQVELERIAALPAATVDVAGVAMPEDVTGGGPAVGPAEAAAIAAFRRAQHEPDVGEDERVRRPTRRITRATYSEPWSARRTSRAPQRRRNAQVATAGWGW